MIRRGLIQTRRPPERRAREATERSSSNRPRRLGMGTRFPRGGLVIIKLTLAGPQLGMVANSRKSRVTKSARTPGKRAAVQLARAAVMASGLRSVPRIRLTPARRTRSMSSRPDPQKGSQAHSSGKGPARRAMAAARGGWEAAGTSCRR